MTRGPERQLVCALALLLSAALSVDAQSIEHPPTLTPEGGAAVPKVSEARRVDLLGAVELYSVALYAEGAAVEIGRLISPDSTKALRIAIGFKEELNRRVSFDWRRELVPRLESGAAAHLYGAMASVRQGDVVLIEYAPGKGTTVRVNRTVAVAEANHDLMLQFLEHWIGQRPVSEEIKQSLIGAPGAGFPSSPSPSSW
jgi:chalcone isomerase-like protein